MGSVRDETLLHLGDVEETAVGGVEEGDAKGKPDTHDPKLNTRCHMRTVDVTNLDTAPVHVHQGNGAEGKGESTQPQDGHVPPLVEKDHASDEDCGPYGGEDDVENTYAINHDGRREVLVPHAKSRTHCGNLTSVLC